MKKLTLDTINLETRESNCDFCHKDKNCVQSLPIITFKNKYKEKFTIEDYNLSCGFWGTKKTVIGNVLSEMVCAGERERVESRADICLDCIKQLYELTKNL